MVVFGKKLLYSSKVVVFGQKNCIRAMLFYTGKTDCIRAKWFYSGIVLVFGEGGCILLGMVVFGQKIFYSGKNWL